MKKIKVIGTISEAAGVVAPFVLPEFDDRPKFHFHVVGVAHTVTSTECSYCPFTTNALNFCRMMFDLGHTVYHYGAEGANTAGYRVEVMSRQEQREIYGDAVLKTIPAAPDWDINSRGWKLFNSRALEALKLRVKPHDFVCFPAGPIHEPIRSQLPANVMCVETGVGYSTTICPYRVFPSYSHMHRMWATESSISSGVKWTDAVIPHPLNFAEIKTHRRLPENYFAFMGRLIDDKGLQIASDICEELEIPLRVAGPGARSFEDGILITEGGLRIKCQYVGVLRGPERYQFLSRAQAVLCPTKYVEPFGLVATEAQACGTPVITSDFGAYAETVAQGYSGFRCRTFDEFLWAAQHVGDLKPSDIENRAASLWDLHGIANQYERYFMSLNDLWTTGWQDTRRLVPRKKEVTCGSIPATEVCDHGSLRISPRGGGRNSAFDY